AILRRLPLSLFRRRAPGQEPVPPVRLELSLGQHDGISRFVSIAWGEWSPSTTRHQVLWGRASRRNSPFRGRRRLSSGRRVWVRLPPIRPPHPGPPPARGEGRGGGWRATTGPPVQPVLARARRRPNRATTGLWSLRRSHSGDETTSQPRKARA